VAHIAALLAVLASGKVWVPLNPKSTQPELRRLVDATEPSILVLDADCAGLLAGAPGQRVWTGGAPAGEDNVAALLARHAGAPQPVIDLPGDATQAIKFTGGTTGAPKGVMQPYRAWMANIANQIHCWGFDQDTRYVVAAPVTHGTSTYLLPILAQGGCHVLLDGSGAEAVRQAFRTRGGTVAFMPPTLVYMLMALPGASRADFPQLRRLIYGGAPMPPEKIREVRAFFGPVLATTYGQTEAPQILTVLQPEDFADERNWASVGRTAWFSDVAIMAPDGRLLPSGEVGEVVARGDLLMTGYWRLPEKTAETLVDGWLHTGDRGLIDERGMLYLKDRLKDMVITGGFNVYPIEVENALGQHPAVHECAVFGVPDDKWGEAVQAAVQLRPERQASEAELTAFVRERLGPVATPKRIHFHTSLPRSPVGKVLKNAVRDLALAAG
jgi:acyl-CoA synthetase (AMP-forming)/AMP-acid ligase II